MTVSTLRPSSTISNAGTLTGAASAHAAMNDNSDASYIEFGPGQTASFNLDDFTLPGGAKIASLKAYIRGNSYGQSIADGVAISGSKTTSPATGYLNAGSPATVLIGTEAGVSWSDPEIDAATMRVGYNGGSFLQIMRAYLEVRYAATPTVSVTAPTGTLTTSNLPTVTWTPGLDSDGGGQTRSRIRIFSAAQYGAGGFNPATSTATVDSGYINNSSTSWTSTAALVNATYRAYVQISQTLLGAYHDSAFTAFSGFIVNVPTPGAPTVVITPGNALGRNQIVVTPAGATSTDAYEVERSDDAGVTWIPVRNAYGLGALILTSGGTTYDYEAGNGLAVQYRARGLHSYGSGAYAAGLWTVQSSTGWASNDWWLKHPNLPARNLLLNMAMLSYSQVNHAARQTAFQPLGANLPIVVSDTRGGATGSVQIVLNSLVLQRTLLTLLDSADTLLLQGPIANGQPDRYVRIGDQTSERVVDKSWALTTKETLPWIEVALPEGAQT